MFFRNEWTVFSRKPLKCYIGWHDIPLFYSSPWPVFPKNVDAVGCTDMGKGDKSAVPCSETHGVHAVLHFRVSFTMQFRSARVGTSCEWLSQAFLTPPVRLSCTSLVCAHCQLNAEGQHVSMVRCGVTGWRSPESLSHCVERKSHGGSLAHIAGHGE